MAEVVGAFSYFKLKFAHDNVLFGISIFLFQYLPVDIDPFKSPSKPAHPPTAARSLKHSSQSKAIEHGGREVASLAVSHAAGPRPPCCHGRLPRGVPSQLHDVAPVGELGGGQGPIRETAPSPSVDSIS